MRYIKPILLPLSIFLIVIISGCKVQGPFYHMDNAEWQSHSYPDKEEVSYSVFFIGDAGDVKQGDPLFRFIDQCVDSVGKNSAVVNLGDNAYPTGLPEKVNKWYPKAEEALMTQVKAFDDYRGELFYIAGNHDWAQGRKSGYRYIRNQAKFLDEKHQKEVFFPADGCPGPVEFNLNDSVTLIILDSEWYFYNYDKPFEESTCGIVEEEDIFMALHDILKRNEDKSVIISAHHPLYSVGEHGGRFDPKLNLFPLTTFNKYLYLPLPGFIYTGGRKYLGHIQDLAHPKYKEFKEAVLGITKNYPNVIYAAGHEHNLQFTEKENIHHIISGAASKTTPVINNQNAQFALSSRGFSRVDYLKNGEVWLRFYAMDEDGNVTIPFEKKLFSYHAKATPTEVETLEIPDYGDSITIVPSDKYGAGAFKKFLLGEHYRDVWNTPVKVKVFDIDKEKGGLNIVKRGGGMQTLSLRMEAADGKQYNLRSVDKYAEKTVPKLLQKTFAARLVQDNISAANPYGAIVTARMAKKVGVYHTNPELVYVADDPRFGIYQEDVAGKLFLFEERPDDDWREADYFGNSKKIKSTPSALNDRLEDNEVVIDQVFVLKNRLFDMWLNDWDRHDDQWRWAQVEVDGEKVYRPIPRDRDQAFYRNEGVFPWIAKRSWALWKLQGFYDIDPDVRGLCFNARFFDRTFLTELTKQQWQQMAEQLQKLITDEDIEQAVHVLPKAVYDQIGEKMIEVLKLRRERIPEMAMEYYHVLAKEVDVLGSEKDEYFKVERMVDGTTRVRVFNIKGDHPEKDPFYDRTFFVDETDEIRLYGISDTDRYEIVGDGNKGILIRIIAGEDKDQITDESFVKGDSKKTLIYDEEEAEGGLIFGSETRFMKPITKHHHDYSRKDFKYDITMPAFFFGLNDEDGLFVGGGASTKIHSFRKNPYQSKHNLTANFAGKTGAFNIRHESEFMQLLRNWDFTLNSHMYGPNYTSNFFGYGNDSEIGDYADEDLRSYYNVRRQEFTVLPAFRIRFSDVSIKLGTFFTTTKIVDHDDRLIEAFDMNGLEESVLKRKTYTGFSTNIEYDNRNHGLFPTSGMYFKGEANWYLGLNAASEDFTKATSDFRVYISRKVNPRTVLAFRVGGGLSNGEHDFIFANSLGGKTNLRGYPATRFYGDATVFQNTDLRIKLANVHSYYFSGQLGLVGFHDIGRVWSDGETSDTWHNGYGGGMWFTPFGLTVITVRYAMSEEYDIFSLKFDFRF